LRRHGAASTTTRIFCAKGCREASWIELTQSEPNTQDNIWSSIEIERIGEKNKGHLFHHDLGMASLRTLFLGVYASNGVIRALFLPICYVLLLSPFLTLLGYYLGFGRTLRQYLPLPKEFAWFDLLPQVVICTVVVFLPTRLLSGSKSKDGGQRRVQSLPYWIPGFKHFWSIVSGGESWLKSVR
jgi:hypothetical protein